MANVRQDRKLQLEEKIRKTFSCNPLI